MTDIKNSFRVDGGLSLDDAVGIFSGPNDPSTGAGEAAPVGSLWLQESAGQLFQKVTNPDTGWVLFSTGGSASSEQAVTKIERSATLAITTSFQSVNCDVTTNETNPAECNHDASNNERINLAVSGLFEISYSVAIDSAGGISGFDMQVLVNGSAVLPGSLKTVSNANRILSASQTAYINATAGDYVELQIKSGATGDVLYQVALNAVKCSGVKGDPGAAGSGSTISLSQDGVPIPNTPHSSINVISPAIIVDNGDGSASVSVPTAVFGSNFRYALSNSVSTTTSSSYQPKLSLVCSNIPAGTYRIQISYMWNHNSTSNDFESRLLQNGSEIFRSKEEAVDSAGSFGATGTNQRVPTAKTIYQTLSTGTYTYDFEYRTSKNGVSSSVWDAVIEFWRVE